MGDSIRGLTSCNPWSEPGACWVFGCCAERDAAFLSRQMDEAEAQDVMSGHGSDLPAKVTCGINFLLADSQPDPN